MPFSTILQKLSIHLGATLYTNKKIRRNQAKMRVRWKILLVKTFICLTGEFIFNSIGLDTLADYSEFVLNRNDVVQMVQLH